MIYEPLTIRALMVFDDLPGTITAWSTGTDKIPRIQTITAPKIAVIDEVPRTTTDQALVLFNDLNRTNMVQSSSDT